MRRLAGGPRPLQRNLASPFLATESTSAGRRTVICGSVGCECLRHKSPELIQFGASFVGVKIGLLGSDSTKTPFVRALHSFAVLVGGDGLTKSAFSPVPIDEAWQGSYQHLVFAGIVGLNRQNSGFPTFGGWASH